MKDTIRNIFLALLAVIIVVGGTYTTIQWDAIVGKWQTEAEREVFKETTAYSEAAASFLADSYKQYNDAETAAEKAPRKPSIRKTSRTRSAICTATPT